MKILNNLLKRKSLTQLTTEAEESGLKKTLNAFDLIMLGIGAIIGSGIFTTIGVVVVGGPEAIGAGPALVVSMLVAMFACIFTAFCYSEFASMIPVSGSAYTYTYATMGEFMAWVIGWILMLEYAIGNIAVASAWTGYFMEFLKGFSHVLPAWLVNPPIWLINDYRSAKIICLKEGLDPSVVIPHFYNIPIAINVPAIILMFLITWLLVKGVKESTKMAAVMVFIKLFVIGLFIAAGAFYIKPENWVPFAPNGWDGIFMGAFTIFFAYIGFDAISTAAEETENPQKNLPLGIIGTLIICTVIYVLTALVLTGIVPYEKINTLAPISSAMSLIGKDWIAGLISVRALAGLTSVILVYQYGTTRILYAMSRDNFLPKILQNIHPKYRTPHVITWVSGAAILIGALFMDINIAVELCNYGAFASFIVVCIAVLILRKTDPKRHRPFKVPFVPLFPILGIICCSLLMIHSWKHLKISSGLFAIWVVVGILIYIFYGYKKQRSEE